MRSRLCHSEHAGCCRFGSIGTIVDWSEGMQRFHIGRRGNTLRASGRLYGYYSRYQYGRHVDGTYSLLEAILSQVLGFKSIR